MEIRDHASRGLSLNDKAKIKEWLQGPKFLWEEEDKWPSLEKVENIASYLFPKKESQILANH